MFTDPNHLRVEDPGKVRGQSSLHLSGCILLSGVFCRVPAGLPEPDELKAHYQRGGLGDEGEEILKQRYAG